MNRILLNGIATHSFKNREEFLSYLDNQKKILIAVNTEKLLNCDPTFRGIVNNNIGYPDGIGAVMALRRKGVEAVKIPGAQFWLDIVGRYLVNKTFFLVGSTEDVIELTVEKLKKEYQESGFKDTETDIFKRVS
jgi:UDP-N-acetyl-D-mannosaminouronate:lipid I N-acetyl-D-mannosaminouronosyltransferase